jgi:hypothetical protein
MSNSLSTFVIPSSGGQRESGGNHPSKFTAKFHRCLGHVEGTVAEPYGVCTASIGYSGSYEKEFRKGARTPKGRARKTKESNDCHDPALRESKMRDNLTKRFGITEFAPGNIGFSPSKKRWYGWSHRAVAGFTTGDTVKPGDTIAPNPDYHVDPAGVLPVGFTAKTLDDAKRMAFAFARAVS